VNGASADIDVSSFLGPAVESTRRLGPTDWDRMRRLVGGAARRALGVVKRRTARWVVGGRFRLFVRGEGAAVAERSEGGRVHAGERVAAARSAVSTREGGCENRRDGSGNAIGANLRD
jgi:hypothetical protein